MYINRQIYLDKIFIKIIIQIYRKETRIDRDNNNVNFVFEYMLSNAKLSNMFVVLHNKQTGEKRSRKFNFLSRTMTPGIFYEYN